MIQLSTGVKALEEIRILSVIQKEKLFTAGELSSSSDLTLAGKLAAKEAFLKSLSIQEHASFYKKIEVKSSPVRKPFIETSEKDLLEKVGNRRISVSISHTDDIAVAVCLLYDEKERAG